MLEKFMLSTFFNSEMLIMVTKNTDGFYAHYLKYVEFYSLLNQYFDYKTDFYFLRVKKLAYKYCVNITCSTLSAKELFDDDDDVTNILPEDPLLDQVLLTWLFLFNDSVISTVQSCVTVFGNILL